MPLSTLGAWQKVRPGTRVSEPRPPGRDTVMSGAGLFLFILHFSCPTVGGGIQTVLIHLDGDSEHDSIPG